MRQMEALAIHRGRTKRKITREKTDRERESVVLFVVRKRSLPPAYETDENTYGQEVKEQQQDRTMCDFGLIY
jgi:hypothetical protein